MQCDFCENKATVFYTKIMDGVTAKACLCEKCAAEKGVTDPDGFLPGKTSFTEELTDDVEGEKVEVSFTAPTQSSGKCPTCGFAFDDLKKTGRLGCDACYVQFRNEIKHNLAGMHKGTSHVGRVPEGMLEAFQHQQRIDELQKQMDEAIAGEDYEKAASLRDEIKKLTESEVATES